ncbi:MAG TPA: ABC transporter permease [Candidatus Angelobacter sp.]
MDAMLRFFRKLWSLIRREQFDRELEEEMAFHREQAKQQYQADGLNSGAAQDAAKRQFGNTVRLKEESRQTVGFSFESAWQDLRYALRQLRKNPGFFLASVLILALGIGASTAIFSAVNPILLEPLPYPQAGGIMMIWDIYLGQRSDVTFHSYRELAARSHSFHALAVLEGWQPTLTGATEPERLEGQSVSADYFRVLGVSPALGRDFTTSDEQFKGPKNVILSDHLWRRRFNADRSIIGRQITLEGDLYSVVGVMPPEFDNILAPSAEIWSPMQYDPGHGTVFDTAEWGHHLHMIGRLRPGMSEAVAKHDFDAIAQAPIPEFPRPPWASLKYGLIVNSLQLEVTRGVRPALLAIIGAVFLLLLIACVNVTNLLLARGAQRRREFAMRTALGASRGRLVRQLFTESLLLAFIGGAVGMAMAHFGLRGLVALSPPELPRVNAIHLDGTVLAFALVATTMIGLIVGLAPAWHASRDDLNKGLERAWGRVAGSHLRTRLILVVAEVALALVLLVSAGLLFHSLERLFSVDPGFDPSHLLTMQVQTSGHQLEDGKARRLFFSKALESARQVPGVASAAFTSLLPLSGVGYGEYGAKFENDAGYNVFRYVVTPGYFATAGVALRRGRLLNDHDTAEAPRVVVISESLARKQFPNNDPLGSRVHLGPLNGPWYTVVGVVNDVKQNSLADSEPDAVYVTTSQSWFADDALTLVVRARGDAATLAPAIRKAIWSVDKDQPIVRVATMDSVLSGSEAQRRFALILFEAFALAALLLAAIGIYGVLAGSVSERTRELGIRSALGASRGSLLALVVGQGMKLTALGVLIGLAGAVAATQGLASLLFGITRLDPATYLGVITLLLGVSAIACWVPARRAARVDPAITLRAE